jgi:GT2 family glycosyltransferase
MLPRLTKFLMKQPKYEPMALGRSDVVAAEHSRGSLLGFVGRIHRALRRRRIEFVAEPGTDVPRNSAAETSSSGGVRVRLRPRGGCWPRGWVEFTLEVRAEGARPVRPRLFLDSGAPFRELQFVVLPAAVSGVVRAVLKLPDVVQALHLNLLDRPGRFSMVSVAMTELSRPEAAVRRLAPRLRRLAREPNLVPGAIAGGTLSVLTGRWSGLREYLREDAHAQEKSRARYAAWVALTEGYLARQAKLFEHGRRWQRPPTISVLMTAPDLSEDALRATIESVLHQAYPHWELCAADEDSSARRVRAVLQEYAARDGRVKLSLGKRNGRGAKATNAALSIATGEWVALLRHDDLLHPLALYYVADAIVRNPGAGLVYTDEDKIGSEGVRCDPYFKCDFNYELLLASNMVGHLGTYRRSLVMKLGGIRQGFEGSQEYDLALRMVERLRPEEIVHVPKVLYHKRSSQGVAWDGAREVSAAAVAARRAVREHLARLGVDAAVEPAPNTEGMTRVRFPVPSPHPRVSVIIPTRDRVDLLGMCLESMESRSAYSNFEIIIVDNGSRERETAAFLERLNKRRYRIIRDDSPFNYSALNNRAVRQAAGEMICLMNNDIEIVTPDWVEEMISFAARPEIGAVGARLWYPDGRLQHAGVIGGLGGVAGHAHKFLPRGSPGYFFRAQVHQSFSAVTAACLMIRKAVYEQVHGLDEALAVAFNDVDFCLRVREAGFRNVWTPYAEMIHHESASRGEERTHEQKVRFQQEVEFIQRRWGDKLRMDPAYSPNLALEETEFSLAFPRELFDSLADSIQVDGLGMAGEVT